MSYRKPLFFSYFRAFYFLLLLFCLSPFLRAQAPTPPLPVELLFGHEELYFQVVVKKDFAPESRFDFFSVATYSAAYGTGETASYRITIPVQFGYDLGKGFGVMAGTDINSAVGFSPIVGPRHNFASRQFLAVTVASFFLNEDRDVKLFGLYEYKPPLSDRWSVYTRLQFIYNHNLREGAHNRSYLYLRAGLKRDAFIFGVGANLDQFGPQQLYADNYGIFARWEFR
jgi:hypothetical protein